MKIQHAIAISSAALAFGHVQRATLHPDGSRETDTTHTVMLAMLVADLAVEEGVAAGLAVQFALVHDLPETYAGDTCTARGLSPEAAADKAAREARSLDRLLAELGGCWSTSMVQRYEAQQEPEARLVRYADKILPKLTHYLNGGDALVAIGMTADEIEHRHAEQGAKLRELYPEFAVTRALFDDACDLALSMMRAREDRLDARPLSSLRLHTDDGDIVAQLVARWARAVGIDPDSCPAVRRIELATERLRNEVEELYRKLEQHVPCQACAWAEARAPEQDEEPPIVRGALDAQAQAERRAIDLTQALEQAERRAGDELLRELAQGVVAPVTTDVPLRLETSASVDTEDFAATLAGSTGRDIVWNRRTASPRNELWEAAAYGLHLNVTKACRDAWEWSVDGPDGEPLAGGDVLVEDTGSTIALERSSEEYAADDRAVAKAKVHAEACAVALSLLRREAGVQ